MSFCGYKFKYRFNASHYIDYLQPETTHSHTFHIVFYLQSKNENIVAFNDIDKKVKVYLNRFSGKCLNHIPPFDKISPILENICKEIYQNVERFCREFNIDLEKLEISDNSLYWYSIGDTLILTEINNYMRSNDIEIFLNNVRKNYYLNQSNNPIDTSNVFDEFKGVNNNETNLMNNDNETEETILENYLNL